MNDYQSFIDSKTQHKGGVGIQTGNPISPMLFDFQTSIVEWALDKGRCAIFADCGLGKTPMQLFWATQIAETTRKPVLVLTPLAVSSQTVREANKFDIDAKQSRDGQVHYPITITNYERLHYFKPQDFSGVVCDESSILKNFDGVRKADITEFMRTVDYRLLCTATAAPNDYVELGTSSESLGYLGHIDMLNQFFTNKLNTTDTKRFRGQGQIWRFKGHAEIPFWKWVASWAKALRSPEDIGFNGDAFTLPTLNVSQTLVKAKTKRADTLFDIDAINFREQREVRRRTVTERCEMAAAKVQESNGASVIWCHLNDEGDLLERLIPGSIQISGKDSDEAKELKFDQFSTGEAEVLIIKPKIGAFGLNWQHCAHVVYFVSYSYEQYYQAIRRCWRFGQSQPVNVNIIGTESDTKIFESLQEKTEAADKMFTTLAAHMIDYEVHETINHYTKEVAVPSWL